MPPCCHAASIELRLYFVRSTDHGRDDVVPACELTLKNLQLDYLDLYLIHWPYRLAVGKTFTTATEDDKFGYSPESEAKCWEVRNNVTRSF